MTEPMTDERLAWIGEWVEKVTPQQAYYGTMRRFMRELLDEVTRSRTVGAKLRGNGEDDLAKLQEWLGAPAPPTPEQLRLCGMTGHAYSNLTVKQQWQVHGRIQEAAAYAWKDVPDNG